MTYFRVLSLLVTILAAVMIVWLLSACGVNTENKKISFSGDSTVQPYKYGPPNQAVDAEGKHVNAPEGTRRYTVPVGTIRLSGISSISENTNGTAIVNFGKVIGLSLNNIENNNIKKPVDFYITNQAIDGSWNYLCSPQSKKTEETKPCSGLQPLNNSSIKLNTNSDSPYWTIMASFTIPSWPITSAKEKSSGGTYEPGPWLVSQLQIPYRVDNEDLQLATIKSGAGIEKAEIAIPVRLSARETELMNPDGTPDPK